MDLSGWWFVESGSNRDQMVIGQIIGDVSGEIFLCQFHDGKASHATGRDKLCTTKWALFPTRSAIAVYLSNLGFSMSNETAPEKDPGEDGATAPSGTPESDGEAGGVRGQAN